MSELKTLNDAVELLEKRGTACTAGMEFEWGVVSCLNLSEPLTMCGGCKRRQAVQTLREEINRTPR